MASKNHKKEKAKIARQRQEESKRLKKMNEANIDEIPMDETLGDIDELVEEKSLSKFDGTRPFIILTLEEIISKLRCSDNNDYEILQTAMYLKHFAKNTIAMYEKFLTESNIEIDKEKRKQIKREVINTTERALLKSEMQSIINEYAFENSIDYGAIKVAFDSAYNAIITGLEERKIRMFKIFVGYGDELSRFEVEYEDSFKKYDLKERIMIFINWNSLDEVYQNYSIYKTKYRNFEDSSINSLVSAFATEEAYEARGDEKFIEYNGVSMNYLIVIEKELKRLACQLHGVKYEDIRFVDAIKYLKKSDLPGLSDDEMIDNLQLIRKIRNKVAHGYTITKDDFMFIKEILLNRQAYEILSWNLKPEDESKVFEYDTEEFFEKSKDIFKEDLIDNLRECLYSKEKSLASHYFNMLFKNHYNELTAEEITKIVGMLERAGIKVR